MLEGIYLAIQGAASQGIIWGIMTLGVYLRLMTEEDTDRIVAWRNSEAVRKNFIYRKLFTRESHENWIRTKVKTGEVVQMIICDISTDTPLGSVYIRDIARQNR